MSSLRTIFMWPSVRREWKQRNHAPALDRLLQLPLVRRARSRDASRKDLPPFGYVSLQQPDVLVVDERDLLVAELAELPAAEEELLAAGLRPALRPPLALAHFPPPSNSPASRPSSP